MHVSTCLVKTLGEAAEFLKRHVCRVECQTYCLMKKIVLDIGKEYVKKIKELEVDRIGVYIAASYTSKEN